MQLGATRFLEKLGASLFTIWFAGLLAGCATTSKFQSLEKTTEKQALLYVLRPTRVALSLWSFHVELFRYEGSFTSDKKSPIDSWSLDSADFIKIRLNPGFYSLRCKDMDKIFYAKEGEIIFLSLELYNRGPFSIPGLFIKSLNVEEALRNLLEGSRMNEIGGK
ncbi:hypothetical protein [Leptospira fainei]|nr:hypothetical protein [Leptospira fainei]